MTEHAKLLIAQDNKVELEDKEMLIVFELLLRDLESKVREFMANKEIPSLQIENFEEILKMRNYEINILSAGDGNFKKGFAPIHIAALFMGINTTKLLLKYGADINLVNIEGDTAFDIAEKFEYDTFKNELLKLGAI